MYKHHVKACLALICAIVVFSGGVAIVDPFNTNDAFVCWIITTGFGVAGTFWGLIKTVTGNYKDDKSFFVSLSGTTGGLFFLGGMAVAFVTSGVSETYKPVVWSAFAFSLLMFILASLIGYLVEPQPEAADHELQKTT